MGELRAPVQDEESVQACTAVWAAFEMKARAEELTASIRNRGLPADLRVRVGVNTGHCTVGVFGSDLLRAYKAVGFAVNVVARPVEAWEILDLVGGSGGGT